MLGVYVVYWVLGIGYWIVTNESLQLTNWQFSIGHLQLNIQFNRNSELVWSWEFNLHNYIQLPSQLGVGNSTLNSSYVEKPLTRG